MQALSGTGLVEGRGAFPEVGLQVTCERTCFLAGSDRAEME